MEGTEWNCHKEGWLNFFYCFEDPKKNTCLFLIDQGGRAQFKVTTSYTKQLLNPGAQMRYKCNTRH